MLESLNAAWQGTSNLELISVSFGLLYIVLAARENILCWPAALIGTATGVVVFWDVSLLMEMALNVYYLAMAVFGWWQWQKGGIARSELAISAWGLDRHLSAVLVIAVLTLISGFILEKNTQAALPYVDSFTTWAAVVTTWMVTRKILENWLYWIIIDCVGVWLFLQKELYLYALLFVLYTVIACFGYMNWHRKFRNAASST